MATRLVRTCVLGLAASAALACSSCDDGGRACTLDTDCVDPLPHCGSLGVCRALSDLHGQCDDNRDCLSGNCSGAGASGGVCTVAAGAPCSGFCLDWFACHVPGNTCEQSCRTDAECPLLSTPSGSATHRPCVHYPGQPPDQSGWCRIPCGSSAPAGSRCPTGWICDSWTPPPESEWRSPAYECDPS